MAGTPRTVEHSVRFYRTLLKAYPAAFRKEYADEMTLVFRDLAADAWRRRGRIGFWILWCRVLGDLAMSVPKEHLAELGRRAKKMKRVMLAVLSVVLAPVICQMVFFCTAAFILLPFVVAGHENIIERFVFVPILYFSIFLGSLLLTRTSSIVAPRITLPIGIVVVWARVAIGDFGPGGISPWLGWGLRVGFVATLGLTSYLGCVVATRMSSWLSRFSLRWFHWVGPLAVLLCIFLIATMFRMILMTRQLGSDLERAVNFSLFGLLAIGIATIVNFALLAVRSYERPTLEQANTPERN